MKAFYCTQLSSEWFQHHAARVTASHLAQVMDFTKGGQPGSKRQTYLRTKLAEMLTGIAIQDNYVSFEMRQGLDREPHGIAAYEAQEGVMVERIGFALHDDIPRFGCSPDGLVGDDGGLELKCPKAGTHLKWILDGVIPEEQLPQIDGEILVTGRAWWDFATFCPEVPKPLQLMVIRRERNAMAEANIERHVRQFNGELDALVERLQKIAGPFNLPAAGPQEPKPEAPDDTPADAYLTDDDMAFFDELMSRGEQPNA